MTGDQRAENAEAAHERPGAPSSWLRRAAINALTPIAAGLVLTVLAPYGTSAFSLPLRLAYWVGLCLTGGIGAIGAHHLLHRWRARTSLWQRLLVQTVGATLCVMPFVLLPFGSSASGGSLALTLFYVAIVALVISAFGEMGRRSPTSASPADNMAASGPSRAPLMDRLPMHLQNARLFAVSGEDHYVRVHTDAGEHMLLMRLGDAIDLCAPVDGARAHRSWWLAREGVERIEREGDRRSIRLLSGRSVPVSRSGAKMLREKGWR